MLDLSSPKAPHIIAAANQLDMILDRCKRVTIVRAERRQFLVETIRPAFAALRWLNVERFGRSTVLSSAITELERKADQLAALPTQGKAGPLPPACCPACGGRLTEPHQYDPVPYCSPCLQIIMRELGTLRDGFGTSAI
jgi:hypothetical protein